MTHAYWNAWYFGWGWFLWFGFVLLLFSSIGNWDYTCRAHRRYDQQPRKQALDILNEKYVRGDITRKELWPDEIRDLQALATRRRS